MQRYFVLPEQMAAGSVMLTGDDARHLAVVMRAQPGDCFIACDGQGREAIATITALDKSSVQAKLAEAIRSAAEMKWRVTIAQSLPKGDKLEIVIQKGTEAGAAAFAPFLSDRTVVQYDERKEEKKVERWRKIAKESAEQSHRAMIPEVRAVSSWKQLLGQLGEYDLALVCYEEEGRAGNGLQPILQAFRSRVSEREPRIIIMIGPEGGFTAREADAAIAAGAQTVGLGKRILRTETAGLYALACLAYESGELGGMDNA